MEVAKIQAQQWLRILTCYFALWLCNLCPFIPGGIPPAALRRCGWGLRVLWHWGWRTTVTPLARATPPGRVKRSNEKLT